LRGAAVRGLIAPRQTAARAACPAAPVHGDREHHHGHGARGRQSPGMATQLFRGTRALPPLTRRFPATPPSWGAAGCAGVPRAHPRALAGGRGAGEAARPRQRPDRAHPGQRVLCAHPLAGTAAWLARSSVHDARALTRHTARRCLAGWDAQLDALLDPSTFVGRAPEQVSRFLAEEVVPALAPYQGQLQGTAEVNV